MRVAPTHAGNLVSVDSEGASDHRMQTRPVHGQRRVDVC